MVKILHIHAKVYFNYSVSWFKCLVNVYYRLHKNVLLHTNAIYKSCSHIFQVLLCLTKRSTYTGCQKKLQTLSFEYFTYFQISQCCGKHVFVQLSRMWEVIENHKLTSVHVMLLFVSFSNVRLFWLKHCQAVRPDAINQHFINNTITFSLIIFVIFQKRNSY